MAISERRRLAFTTIAVILMGTVTAFLLLSALLPSTASIPTPAPGSVEVYIKDNDFPADATSIGSGTGQQIYSLLRLTTPAPLPMPPLKVRA